MKKEYSAAIASISVAEMGALLLSIGVGIMYGIGHGLCVSGVCCVPVAFFLFLVWDYYTDVNMKKLKLEITKSRDQLIKDALEVMKKDLGNQK